MIKLVVVAALAASCIAVPTLPASAATALTKDQANCLVFPLLKKECWEKGAAAASSATKSVAAATEAAVTDTKLPLWWKCTPAAKGSGHLLDC
jgi:hypothetical protein